MIPLAVVLAIVGVSVIHPELDGKIEPDRTILVENGRIRAVGPRASTPIPKGATVLDAAGKWVLPGLIDSHVHFFQSGNLYTRPDAADFNRVVPYKDEVARNQARLSVTFKVWLASGVTSVADVGGPFWNFRVRDAAARSQAAPRVIVAGPLISMIADPPLDLDDPPIIQCHNPDEARALVARQLAQKPDLIKVWFIHRKGDDLAAQTAIVRATADAAHAAGVRLAVHATELETATEALRAGADILVHSVEDRPVDDELLRLAKARHAVYIPTLVVMNGYRTALSGRWQPTDAERRLADPQILAHMGDLARIPPDQLPPGVTRLMSQPAPSPPPEPPSSIGAQNLLRVWNAGIEVALGTDAGNIGTLHGPSVFREVAAMAAAGLTPAQVLRAATVGGARVMGLERSLGAVAVGKRADLLILPANPLEDLERLSHAWRVIKDGVVFDPVSLMRSISP